VRKIEHIGIAVQDIDAAEETYTKLFGKGPYKREVVKDQGVITSFFKCGPNKIELIAPLGVDSVLHGYFKKHRSGLHHMALAVHDIQMEIDRLVKEGFVPVSQSVTLGADNRRIFFFHPKSTEGVLLELCQLVD
tara:strand:+ start:2849 stop:3250 length:402 start_codon:yes stop_codon:yes gene_type:complete